MSVKNMCLRFLFRNASLFSEDDADGPGIFPEFSAPAIMECHKFTACAESLCLVPDREVSACGPPIPNALATKQVKNMAVINVSICKYCVLLRGLRQVDSSSSGLKEFHSAGSCVVID